MMFSEKVHKMHVIKTNHMWVSREKHSRHESVPEKGCKVEKWALLLPFLKVDVSYQAKHIYLKEDGTYQYPQLTMQSKIFYTVQN